jgi:hypothetical protein
MAESTCASLGGMNGEVGDGSPAEKPSGQGEPSTQPPQEHRGRTLYESEALVAFAGAVSVGVFAVPFELSQTVRYLLAAMSAVAILAILGRYPQLSSWLVRSSVKIGPLVLLGLAALLILVVSRPSFRITEGTTRVLVAALGPLALRLPETGIYFWRYRSTLQGSPSRWLAVLLMHLVEAGLGAIGCIYVRGASGGVAFTHPVGNAFFVGAASYCLYRQVLAIVTAANDALLLTRSPER